jgi:hypothetical protein
MKHDLQTGLVPARGARIVSRVEELKLRDKSEKTCLVWGEMSKILINSITFGYANLWCRTPTKSQNKLLTHMCHINI